MSFSTFPPRTAGTGKMPEVIIAIFVIYCFIFKLNYKINHPIDL